MSKEKQAYICANCYEMVIPYRKTPGWFLLELVLWMMFIVPGLFYTIWRISNKFDACPVCESKDVAHPDSPRGQMILAQLQQVGINQT